MEQRIKNAVEQYFSERELPLASLTIEKQHVALDTPFTLFSATVPSIDSTHSFAEQWRGSERGMQPDQVVLLRCEEQTSGRGQRNNTWGSPRGNLYMTLMCTMHEVDPKQLVTMQHVAALAVCQSVREYTQESASFKWINDVFMRDRKLSGVLVSASTEGTATHLSISVGVNLTSAPVPTAIALEEVTGEAPEAGRFAHQLTTHLLHNLARPVSENLQEVSARLQFHGEWVEVWDLTLSNVLERGIFRGLDEWGFALLAPSAEADTRRVMEGRMRRARPALAHE